MAEVPLLAEPLRRPGRRGRAVPGRARGRRAQRRGLRGTAGSDARASGALWRIELMHRGEPDQQALAARLAPLAERSGLDAHRPHHRAARRHRLAGARGRELHAAAGSAASGCTAATCARRRPRARSPIELDAGLAFGSGEHASTRGCLLALDDLAPAPPLPPRPRHRLRLRHPGDRRRQMLAGRRARGRQRSRRGRRGHGRTPRGTASAHRVRTALQRRLPRAAEVRAGGALRPDPRQHPGRPVVRHGARSRPPSGARRHARSWPACSTGRRRA